MEFLIENQQNAVEIPEQWISLLEQLTLAAIPLSKQHALSDDAPLHHLDCLEITLVDNPTSERVHQEFMNIDGATDVITFHHGEIIIGAEVALTQSSEYGEPFSRELFRYMVHGLLHLAGHDDIEPSEHVAMHAIQESIITQLWTPQISSSFQ